MLHVRLTRRTFIGAMSAMAASSLLAACADEDADDDDVDDEEPAAPDDDTDDEDDGEDEDTPEPDDEEDEDDGDEPAEPGEDAVLRVATNEDLVDLHFDNLHIAGDRVIIQQIMNNLITFAPGTLDPEPDLAEDWEVSDDGLTYTFNLRDGVQFHHGYGQVTSEDVRATIEHHMDPDSGSRETAQYALVESVEAPEPLTAVINMSEPNAAFVAGVLAWQSGFIASAAAIEELGDDLSFNPVGAGPYYFEEWLEGEQITLHYFEDYYGDAPEFTTLQFRVIPDDSLAILALEQDEVDAVPIRQLGAYREIQERPELPLHQAESGWQYWAYFQHEREPTDDVLVRQALAHATDLEAISNAVDGMVSVNPSFLNPLVLGWTDDITTYEYDLEQAASLLEEAGFSEPGEVTLQMIYSEAHLYEEMALILQDMWSEFGVNAEVSVIDRALFAEEMRGGEWNVGIWAITRLESDIYSSDFMHSEGPSNYSNYSNPEADELIDQARVEQDTDARAELYEQIQEHVAQDLPVMCTGTMVAIIASRPGLTEVHPHPYVGLVDYVHVRSEE